MKKNKIIVTGGAGFVGTNLIKLFLKMTKLKIISIDNYSSGSKKNHVKNKRVKYIKADINETDLLLKSLDGIDIICHCASLLDSKPFTKDQYFTSNIKGTQNLYNSAKKKE